ncbi:TROVE domain protein [Klosneuvirus KNV1]|uniref:TROVE domain protein n=1 Tax=Klosneuvirus KNV1 TaxID=1977640 RepID=A0A1V0SKD1_9VIRU|nr:TROVE domain protein [Klosneuvirus KNV1]
MKAVYNNVLAGLFQQAPAPQEVMIPNRGGGYGFEVTDKTLIERVLILGTPAGYYSSAVQNTDEAISKIKEIIAKGSGNLVLEIVRDVYEKSRAAKQDPTFVVLALLCTNENLELRQGAWEVVVSIRNFSHLCTFLKYYMANNGGWGRLPKRSLNRWITGYTGKDLMYQVFKYLSRDGWTFRDILRCVHTSSDELPAELRLAMKTMILYGKKDVASADAFDQALKFGQEINASAECLSYLEGIKFLKTCPENDPTIVPQIIQQIQDHSFTHEFLPKWALTHKDVWLALLVNKDKTKVKMPMTALIRNLATLTVRGVFDDQLMVNLVVNHLQIPEVVKHSRIHPATIAVAWKQYSAGHSDKGKQVWTPNQQIVTAMEKSMYLAFANVEPTGKKILHCFDGSGSMSSSMGVVGNMSSAEAVALLGLICSKTEQVGTQQYCVFSSQNGHSSWDHGNTGLRFLAFSPDSSLSDAANITQITDWGSTDCSLPMEQKLDEFKKAVGSKLSNQDQSRLIEAIKNGDSKTVSAIHNALGLFLPEAFVIYTDNDVNSGKRHPFEALKEYRQVTGIPAKMAVVATQASRVSIAQPSDAGMMDLVGFDSQLPVVLHDFVCGKL